jgi:hypothetical protein
MGKPKQIVLSFLTYCFRESLIREVVAESDRQNQTIKKERADQSSAAVKAAAQKVAKRIPGATLGLLSGQQVINFSGNFDQTVSQLSRAGYYSGVLAFNPFHHPGGQEFRTYGSPGFHFKVVYSETKVVPVFT